MNAIEARDMTNENLKSPVIDPYLGIIYTRIECAAKEGKSSVTHPFHVPENLGYESRRQTYPSSPVKQAIYGCLRSQGYEIIEHEDPDPGHPCSCAYDEIKW